MNQNNRNHQSPPSLSNLPLQTVRDIGQYLNLVDRSQISRTCRGLYEIFKVERPAITKVILEVYFDSIRAKYGDDEQETFLYYHTDVGIARSSGDEIFIRHDGQLEHLVIEDLYDRLPTKRCKVEQLEIGFIAQSMVDFNVGSWLHLLLLDALKGLSTFHQLRVLNLTVEGIQQIWMNSLVPALKFFNARACQCFTLSTFEVTHFRGIGRLNHSPFFSCAAEVIIRNAEIPIRFILEKLCHKKRFEASISTISNEGTFEAIKYACRNSVHFRTGTLNLNRPQTCIPQQTTRENGYGGSTIEVFVSSTLIQITRVENNF